MKLSAVVITFNEEKNIERCLKSLSFAGEIIVVDSRSTDKTVQIAKKFTKKIIYRDFDGFSKVKNAGIEKARGEWILSLDADEEVTPELRARITEIISGGPAEEAYLIKRLTMFLGGIIRHSGWGTRDYQLRLFKKNAGRFEGDIHEAVRIKGRPGRIEEHMLHHSYPDTGTYIKKMNRYTSMQALDKKSWPLARMIFNPFITFFTMFFLKAGFRDGLRGFVLAVYSGFSEFTRFAKMLENRRGPGVPGIIVRMPNWVGDCVMATAFLPGLKARYKKTVLVVKKGAEPVFEGNPAADSVITYDKRSVNGFFKAVREIRKTGIKTAVSLSPSFSSHLMLKLAGIKSGAGYSDDLGNILLANSYKRDKSHRREHVIKEYANVLSLLGMNFDIKKIRQELFVDPKKEKKFLKDSGLPPSLKLRRTSRKLQSSFVLAPYAGFGPSKAWPFEYYEELALAIIRKSKKNHVYITGGAHEGASGIRQGLAQSKQFHDLRGIPLQQAFMLIKNAKLFIGNDSGLMHAADALGVPSFVIFGSTAPFWGGPISKKAKIIYKGIECQPCFKKTCRYGHYKCLKEIKVSEVLNLIKKSKLISQK